MSARIEDQNKKLKKAVKTILGGLTIIWFILFYSMWYMILQQVHVNAFTWFLFWLILPIAAILTVTERILKNTLKGDDDNILTK